MHRGREHLVEHLCAGEDLERPRLQRGRTRLTVGLRFAFDDPGKHAVTGQIHRGEQS